LAVVTATGAPLVLSSAPPVMVSAPLPIACAWLIASVPPESVVPPV
jgi:hypothetical protein